MKNLKFLVIALALLIGIASCKKEEKAVVVDNPIVGTWVITKELRKGYRNGNLTSESINPYNKEENLALPLTDVSVEAFEFKNDGTGNYYEKGKIEEVFNYNSNSVNIVIFWNGTLKEDHTIKSFNNNVLVLNTETEKTKNSEGEVIFYTREFTLKRKF